MPKDYVSLTYDRFIHETDGAILFQFGEKKQWIPKKLIDPDFLPLNNGNEVAIEFWFIKQEGLEGFEA